MTAHKAWAAALVAFLTPIVAYLYDLANGAAWDWRHLLGSVLGGLAAAAVGGGATWVTPNTPKVIPEHSTAAVALENPHSPNMEG